jgi:hypothetical protein
MTNLCNINELSRFSQVCGSNEFDKFVKGSLVGSKAIQVKDSYYFAVANKSFEGKLAWTIHQLNRFGDVSAVCDKKRFSSFERAVQVIESIVKNLP